MEEISPQEAENDARFDQTPAVVAADAKGRSFRPSSRTFHTQTMIVSRSVVTFLIAAACLLVFVAMVARGVSPMEPSGDSLIEWGANFGPSMVFDGSSGVSSRGCSSTSGSSTWS